jgi:hypothetical protein
VTGGARGEAPAQRIGSRASWVASIAPPRSRSSVPRHWSARASGKCGSTCPPPPALFTRTCSSPASCTANPIMRRTCSSEVISASTNHARPPCASMTRAASTLHSGRHPQRSQARRRLPVAERSRALCQPQPRSPPRRDRAPASGSPPFVVRSCDSGHRGLETEYAPGRADPLPHPVMPQIRRTGPEPASPTSGRTTHRMTGPPARMEHRWSARPRQSCGAPGWMRSLVAQTRSGATGAVAQPRLPGRGARLCGHRRADRRFSARSRRIAPMAP